MYADIPLYSQLFHRSFKLNVRQGQQLVPVGTITTITKQQPITIKAVNS